MRFKKGVDPRGIRSELVLALFVASGVYSRYGQELVVTSLNDSKHSYGSLHYSGAAADLRTHYFAEGVVEEVAKDLREALGDFDNFDVVVEKTHIHLEYQPKRV